MLTSAAQGVYLVAAVLFVLSLAGLAKRSPEEALSSILQGTANVLDVVRDIPALQKLVYVSSSMAYGNFVTTPKTNLRQTFRRHAHVSKTLKGHKEQSILARDGRLMAMRATVCSNIGSIPSKVPSGIYTGFGTLLKFGRVYNIHNVYTPF